MIQNHILQKFENIHIHSNIRFFNFSYFSKNTSGHTETYENSSIFVSRFTLMVFENNSEFYRNFYSSNSHSMVS